MTTPEDRVVWESDEEALYRAGRYSGSSKVVATFHPQAQISPPSPEQADDGPTPADAATGDSARREIEELAELRAEVERLRKVEAGIRALADDPDGCETTDDGLTYWVEVESLRALLAPSPAALRDPLSPPTLDVEAACEVMHNAYEKAAVGAGWETNPASRKPWSDVPEANKSTMRAAVTALLASLSPTPVVAAAVSEAQAEIERSHWAEGKAWAMVTAAEAEVERLREVEVGIAALADEWLDLRDRLRGPEYGKLADRREANTLDVAAGQVRALLVPSPAATTGEATDVEAIRAALMGQSVEVKPRSAEPVCCGDHDEDGGRPCNGCPERAPVPSGEAGGPRV